MGIRNKNKPKKINLLEMSDAEKLRTIREIKQNLRLRAAEAKLWRSLLETDSITINKQQIICEGDRLIGLSPSELLKSC